MYILDKIYAKNSFFEMLKKVAAVVVFGVFFIIFMNTRTVTWRGLPWKISPPVLIVFFFGFQGAARWLHIPQHIA